MCTCVHCMRKRSRRPQCSRVICVYFLVLCDSAFIVRTDARRVFIAFVVSLDMHARATIFKIILGLKYSVRTFSHSVEFRSVFCSRERDILFANKMINKLSSETLSEGCRRKEKRGWATNLRIFPLPPSREIKNKCTRELNLLVMFSVLFLLTKNWQK